MAFDETSGGGDDPIKGALIELLNASQAAHIAHAALAGQALAGMMIPACLKELPDKMLAALDASAAAEKAMNRVSDVLGNS